MNGIILIHPHGELIAVGKKKALVKSKPLDSHVGERLIFLTGDSAFGELTLKEPVEISLDEFRRRFSEHQVTEAERLRWWGNADPLFLYEFTLDEVYEKPKKIFFPEGAQTFVLDVQVIKSLEEQEDEFEKAVRQPWGSPGGKRWLAGKIASALPDHVKYVEPFAGGAAVFWAKEPSNKEVLADLDEDIIDAFKFIQGMSDAEFKKLSALETEREPKTFERLKESKPKGKVEKFHRWLYLRCLSHGAEGKTVNPSPKSNYTLKNVLARLGSCKERLAGVSLLSQDWRKTVREQDGKNVVIYLDPPYAETTCDGLLPDGNKPPTSEEIEEVLAKVEGSWILSLNDSPNVRKAFEKYNVRRVKTPALRAEGAVNKERKELLISNVSFGKGLDLAFEEDDEAVKVDFERNPKKEEDKELVFTHSLLHTYFKRKVSGAPLVVNGKARTLEDIINYHALVLQEMKRRDIKHVPHDDLDRRTYDLLGWELPEEMKKQSPLYAPVYATGSKQEGGKIYLRDFVDRLRSFKLRHEFGYIVGAIANHGVTENDIDFLWRGQFNDDLAIPLQFRVYRQCPRDWWTRFHFLQDTYFGPFTNAVAAFDLVVKLTNPLEAREDLDAEFAGLQRLGWEELEVVRSALDREGMTVEKLKEVIGKVVELQRQPRMIQMGLAEEFSDLEKMNAQNLSLLLDVFRQRRDVENPWLADTEREVEDALKKRLIEEDIEKQEARAASVEVQRQADQSRREDKVVPFRFFLPPKPERGAYEEDRQTVENFVSLFEDEDFPIFSSKKYDGINVEIHRKGDKVQVWSEDGDEQTSRYPKLVEAVRDIKADSIVMLAELETWENGEHRPREVMAGYAHSSGEADDSKVVANVYRVVYLDGNDVHSVPNEEAIRLLKSVGMPGSQSTWDVPDTSKKLNKIPFVVSENRAELIEKTHFVDRKVASEGNVAYPAKRGYSLKQERGATVKYHRTEVIKGIVAKRIETKVKGVFNYEFGIIGPEGVEPKETVDIDGKKFLRVGKAFSTDVRVEPGETILVEYETLNVVNDEKKKTVDVSAWAPRFQAKAQGKPDTFEEAVAKARRSRLLVEKVVKETGETVFKQDVEKQEDAFLTNPSEGRAYKFVVQEHWRGKSVHADWRFETEDKDFLLGWTLNTLIAGAVKEPVTTLSGAKALAKNSSSYSKIDWTTGKWAQRKKAGAEALVNVEIVSERKAPEPRPWLDVEGKTKDPVPGEPPPVGATRNFPGVFNIVDRGLIEYGSQKVWLHEYFTDGGAFAYRLFFRQLRASALRGKSDGQLVSLVEALEEEPGIIDLLITEANNLGEELTRADGDLEVLKRLSEELAKQGREVVIPAAETELKTEGVWLLIKPLDQTPYVLSKGAVEDKFVPEQGISALPSDVKKLVPERFRYWTLPDEKKRLEIRNALIKALDSGEVDIEFEGAEKQATREVEKDSRFFLLTSRFSSVSDMNVELSSRVGDHEHSVELDESGSGLSNVEFGHCHAVENFEVEQEDGHSHEVMKQVKEATFVLHRKAFRKKGEKPIREGPSTVEFDLRLDVGEPSLWLFKFEHDPSEAPEASGFFERDRRKENMDEGGKVGTTVDIEPGHPLNSTEDTLLSLSVLDRGDAQVLIDDPDIKKVRFQGDRMKGFFLFSKHGDNWKVERTSGSPALTKGVSA